MRSPVERPGRARSPGFRGSMGPVTAAETAAARRGASSPPPGFVDPRSGTREGRKPGQDSLAPRTPVQPTRWLRKRRGQPSASRSETRMGPGPPPAPAWRSCRGEPFPKPFRRSDSSGAQTAAQALSMTSVPGPSPLPGQSPPATNWPIRAPALVSTYAGKSFDLPSPASTSFLETVTVFQPTSIARKPPGPNRFDGLGPPENRACRGPGARGTGGCRTRPDGFPTGRGPPRKGAGSPRR